MTKSTNQIIVKGARQHNLKNINISIPRNKLVVITGLSGSGKSSLAFDTIYAEGQRRYVESLSAYARQFLGLMEKPNMDSIEGLSPAIAIEQKATARNPRSTVGTVTEIHDYLRLLFSHLGIPHCWKCGNVIKKQTVQQIVDLIAKLEKDLDAALVKETDDMREVAASAMDRDVNRRLLEIIKESGVNLHEGAQGVKVHYDIARKSYMEGLTAGLNKD